MSTTVSLVTCKNAKQGERIAKALVAERLAACVNVVPRITSIYRWKGKSCRDAECLLIIKSRTAHSRKIARRVKELHTYSVPEVIQVAVVSGNPEYLRWIREST